MCLLSFLFTLLLSAAQASGELSLSYSQFSTKNTSATLGTPPSQIQTSMQDLLYNREAARGGVSFHLGLSLFQRDLDQYRIVNRQGEEIFLSEIDDGRETRIRGGLGYQLGDYIVDGSISRSITQGALRQHSFTFGVSRSLYSLGADLYLSFSRTTEIRPLSYFVNPESLRSEELVTEVNHDYLALTWQQIITERFKTALSLSLQQRREERPLGYGVRLTNLYALHHSYALFSAFEYINERTNKLPKNGTGFYDLFSYEIGAQTEISYNWRARILAGQVFEEESARGSLPQTQVKTNTFSLAVNSDFLTLNPSLTFRYENSNNGRSAISFLGGLTWII